MTAENAVNYISVHNVCARTGLTDIQVTKSSRNKQAQYREISFIFSSV